MNYFTEPLNVLFIDCKSQAQREIASLIMYFKTNMQ